MSTEEKYQKALERQKRQLARYKAKQKQQDKLIEQLKEELKRSRRGDKTQSKEQERKTSPKQLSQEQLLNLSTSIYLQTPCGLRSVIRILELLGRQLPGSFVQLPSYTSLRNWLLRCGLSLYEQPERKQAAPYALILDESMLLGSQKLMCGLSVSQEHTQQPLSMEQVELVHLAVRRSWNSKDTSAFIQELIAKQGSAPSYVIADNASVLKSALRQQQLLHVPDLSHTLGMFLERAYKNAPDFKLLMKELSQCSQKYVMTNEAYLLPPKQRVIARFMNLRPWVKWAERMLLAWGKLSPSERRAYGFLRRHQGLIQELALLLKYTQFIERELKQHGLQAQFLELLLPLEEDSLSGSLRVAQVLSQTRTYLESLLQAQEGKHKVQHLSSDIIESLFGYYKAMKSPNKQYGVTSLVLLLPLMTSMAAAKGQLELLSRLKQTPLHRVHSWAKQRLLPSPVSLRNKVLRKS